MLKNGSLFFALAGISILGLMFLNFASLFSFGGIAFLGFGLITIPLTIAGLKRRFPEKLQNLPSGRTPLLALVPILALSWSFYWAGIMDVEWPVQGIFLTASFYSLFVITHSIIPEGMLGLSKIPPSLSALSMGLGFLSPVGTYPILSGEYIMPLFYVGIIMILITPFLYARDMGKEIALPSQPSFLRNAAYLLFILAIACGHAYLWPAHLGV